MTKQTIAPIGALCQRIGWRALDPKALRRLVRLARAEDLAGEGFVAKPSRRGDATTRAVVGREHGQAELRARREMVACGLPLVPLVLEAYGGGARFRPRVRDGAEVAADTVLGTLLGPARVLLQAERVLLNFLQRLSGIATYTRAHVRALGDSPTRLLDTRKTTPGYRALEKYAVATGGAWNHRLGLFDRVLIKDNHLAASGATRGDRLAHAVRVARHRAPGLRVEVEIDALEQLEPVLEAGADVVMFDNFSLPDLRVAVARAAGRTRTEASGGITVQTLPALAHVGLDFISTGALVHQSTWIDIGLDWV
ncbi:carboxylating nicotinate-nucleotide diphosphorylase [Opitutales bacterium ASA1]|nr:carboxylating nicotinate-nucleotide diphosphorylase [Opitutales bacterium ASA1]